MKSRSFFMPMISVCLLLLSGALSAAEFDSRMKLRADAPGGAFTDREALTFRLVNNTPRPETYTVENWKGGIVAQGEWPAGDAPLTLEALPHGHYLLKTASGACAFAVLPDPAARRVSADAPFNLDTHISWTGGDNASAGYPGEAGYRFIAELGRRAGTGFLRDRMSWLADLLYDKIYPGKKKQRIRHLSSFGDTQPGCGQSLCERESAHGECGVSYQYYNRQYSVSDPGYDYYEDFSGRLSDPVPIFREGAGPHSRIHRGHLSFCCGESKAPSAQSKNL